MGMGQQKPPCSSVLCVCGPHTARCPDGRSEVWPFRAPMRHWPHVETASAVLVPRAVLLFN